MSREPRLYFSFRSPYSWMAVQRLRAAVPDLPAVLRMIPFWDPDPITERALAARGAEFHYVQMSHAKHLYILGDTKRLAARFGFAMAWPIDVDPWWEVPHLAFLAARREGGDSMAMAFYDAVTTARWSRGENICDPDVLAKACDSAGLDGVRLAAAVDDPLIRDEATGCLERAYLDDVFGIPYVKIGRHRYWGLDRVDQVVETLADRTVAPSGAPVDAKYDHDTAGGCG